MYCRVKWLPAGSLLCRRGGVSALGLHTFSERQGQTWHCTRALVSPGESTWEEELASRFHHHFCMAEMPCGTQICKKGRSESGQTQLLEKRSLSDPASVSWACHPELTSYLESFSYGFLWFIIFSSLFYVPIPLPWHETCQGHSFSPSPLQSVSLSPNFWSTAISTTWSILFSHFMGLFGFFPSQITYWIAGITDH